MRKKKISESNLKIWFKNLQEKKRIVILNEDSFEEKRNFTTSKLSLFIIFLFSIIVFSCLFFLLISYTSLKTFISGYPNPTAQKELMDKNIKLHQKLNELMIQTEKEEQYIQNIQKILKGDTPKNRNTDTKKFTLKKNNGDNLLSESEITIRKKVDKREKYDIDVIPGGALTKNVLPELLLFPPIFGELTIK